MQLHLTRGHQAHGDQGQSKVCSRTMGPACSPCHSQTSPAHLQINDQTEARALTQRWAGGRARLDRCALALRAQPHAMGLATREQGGIQSVCTCRTTANSQHSTADCHAPIIFQQSNDGTLRAVQWKWQKQDKLKSVPFQDGWKLQGGCPAHRQISERASG